MENQDPKVFKRLYGAAKTYSDLPWHDPEPPALLVEALGRRQSPGRALDIGCGAGTYSLYMAERGYAVTAIDFMPQAIEMVRQRAADAGCEIEAVQADIKTWSVERPFDVILDVGCLHSLALPEREAYKQQLCRWLAPGGDFILVHMSSRGWWDRWPIGPRRIDRADVTRLFAPELTLRDYDDAILRFPLFMGRSARVGRYWFTKASG